jgi:nucleotide-binding universal stress UspA family protein
VYKRIMVPLDGSKLAECVLPHLETAVKGSDSPEVMLVRAVEPIAIPYGRETTEITSMEQLKAFEAHNRVEAEKYLEEIAARLKNAGINAKTYVLVGKAAEVLSDFAAKNDLDLVIMATHGRSGISRWVWGSVADRLIRSLCIPVLVVRPPVACPEFRKRSSAQRIQNAQ